MGRPRLPNVVHINRGNPSKKPIESLLGGVNPEVEIPNCPDHLVDEAKIEYERVSKELEKLGLISKIDRAALVAYCSAWAETVFCEKKIAALNANDPENEAGLVGYTPNGYKQTSVWVQIRNRAYERMGKFMTEFGMSPSSRTKATPSENNQLSLPGMEPDKTGWNGM